MSSLKLTIVTPETTVYDGDVDSITVPTADGEITVLPHHVPLVSIVIPGTIIVKQGNVEKVFAVSRGVIEVDGKSMRILADSADRAEELEEAAIEKAKAAAEQLMTERRGDTEGFTEAAAVLAKELARLKTVRRHRSRGSTPSHQ